MRLRYKNLSSLSIQLATLYSACHTSKYYTTSHTTSPTPIYSNALYQGKFSPPSTTEILEVINQLQTSVDNKLMSSLLLFVGQTRDHHALDRERIVKGLVGVVEMLIQTRNWEKASKLVEAMMDARLPTGTRFFNPLLLHKILCSDLAGVWRFWRTMQAASLVPTNEVLQSLQKRKGLQWDILSACIRAKRSPDPTFFATCFRDRSNKMNVEEGKLFLQTMHFAGVTPNLFMFNSVLFMMVEHPTRYAQASMELFNELKASSVVPNVATYNSIMNIKRKTGDVNGCFALFEEMENNKLEPDVYSYNILMNIRGKQRDEVGVTSILNELLASNIAPTRASFNILLKVIADRGDINSCQQVLAQMIKQFGSANLFAYNCVLECVAKQHEATTCMALLHEMKQMGMEPDSTALNTILKHFPGPCELHAMVQNVKRDTRTYNILLGTAIAQQDASMVISLIREMKRSHVSPDTATYATVLKAIIAFKDIPVGTGVVDLCTTAAYIAELNQSILDMRQGGLLPNIVSYQILIAEAAENGDIKSCQQLVEEMAHGGLQMDAKFYGTIVDKLAKRGYWKEAKIIFSEIQNTGLELDARIYDILLANTAKNGSFQDCVSLFEEMKAKNLCSAHSFSTMVNAAAANKRWSECHRYLDNMRAHHFVPTAHTYTALVSHVLACGDLPQYRQLFRGVQDTNVGDQTLYTVMHRGLNALLTNDKWKQIQLQVMEDVHILQAEMTSKGLSLPETLKRGDKTDSSKMDHHAHGSRMPSQTVQSMLNCL